jgi:hypothetical protein
MKKVVIIILIVLAVPIYTYDIYILIKGQISSIDNKSNPLLAQDSSFSIARMLKDAKPVHFEIKGRSPFTPYKTVPVKQPVAVVKKIKMTQTPLPVNAPKITINGIMWNPQNPVAMLIMPDGSSVMAKTGQVFGDITIKKIDKNKVVVMSGKKEFVIERN